MDRNTMMMIAIGALILAVLYLYRDNQKLRKPVAAVVEAFEPAEVPAPKKRVTFEEKAAEKSVPTESE
jgi:hypothetical protein